MILPRGGGGIKKLQWKLRNATYYDRHNFISVIDISYYYNDLCHVFNSVKNVIKRELKPVCMCATDSIVITTQSECHKVLTPNSSRQSAPIC